MAKEGRRRHRRHEKTAEGVEGTKRRHYPLKPSSPSNSLSTSAPSSTLYVFMLTFAFLDNRNTIGALFIAGEKLWVFPIPFGQRKKIFSKP